MAHRTDVRGEVTVRHLRRWESPSPPLPHPGQQAVPEALLGVPLDELGFTVPPERARRIPSGGCQEGAVQRRRFVVDVGVLLGASVLAPAQTGRRIGAADVTVAVRPRWRRQGVATRMHRALIEGIDNARVMLNTRPEATAAQASYRAWGYTRVGSAIPWDGAARHDVMVLDLIHPVVRA
ncbi:GNAT family N-acetyltransferase [Kitasatospora sp. NPDC094016]|uniref:GNAT family N-acetyltransferase n=1 Tax=Kitasatospora sp. NPDC094016 TaxID=3154986 RepID=UPI0033202EC5